MPNTFIMTDTLVHPLEGKTTAAAVVKMIAIKAILAIRLVTEDVVVVVIDILIVLMVTIATKVPFLGTLTI